MTPWSLIEAARKLPRLVIVPLLYKNPSVVPPVNTVPAIWPWLLIDMACRSARVRGVSRSVTAPFCHSTRWALPLVSRHSPAIWPVLLTASAAQPKPPVKPGSGRLVMVPLLYRKACMGSLVPHWPTTWPESLIPFAPPAAHPAWLTALMAPPPTVPRSVIWPLLYKNACQGCSAQVFFVLP